MLSYPILLTLYVNGKEKERTIAQTKYISHARMALWRSLWGDKGFDSVWIDVKTGLTTEEIHAIELGISVRNVSSEPELSQF